MDIQNINSDLLKLVVLLGTADFQAEFFSDEHSDKIIKDRVREAYALAINLRRQVNVQARETEGA